jgi:cytochrome aa3-600 menaquinol oxidase subunit 2
MLVKYRGSKQSKDYEPPHIEGSAVVETIWTAIPIIIVAFLSVVTVVSLKDVEATPKGHENKEPLVIYASSSNWKWHFSYPEENIETVNYVYVPTDRPLEFKLYSYGPISSFWIPQLGGQKYAMADMVTTLHLLADEPGEMWGRNSNFSGKGSAHQLFDVQAVSPAEFEEWVEEAKAKSEPLTEEKFDKLLKTEYVGRQTFTGTHLEFSPAPEHGNHGKSDEESDLEEENHTEENHSDHSNH